jgi:hypothetical protein
MASSAIQKKSPALLRWLTIVMYGLDASTVQYAIHLYCGSVLASRSSVGKSPLQSV